MSNAIELLNISINDLADLPEFASIKVSGVYRMQFLGFEAKNNEAGQPVIDLKVSYQEAIDIPSGQEVSIEQGTELKFSYFLLKKDGQNNAFAQGELKSVLTAMAAVTGKTDLAGNNEVLAGNMMDFTIKAAPQKDNPERFNVSIKSVTLA